MKIQPVIITCPGREQLLDLTLKSFRSTDWTQSDPMISMDTSQYERRQQRQEMNSLRALKLALETPADYCLFLEDDVEFNSYLEHNLKLWCWSRSIWLGSLYAPWDAPQEVDGCDYEVPADYVYGSQAFLLSAKLAEYCVEHWDDVEGMQDVRISRLAQRGGKIFYHHPSLVQHVGHISTWGGTAHSSPTFSKGFRSNGVHPRGYFLDDSSDGQYCDEGLATLFCTIFQGRRVHDLGCGNGEYVRRMRQVGIDVLGFDGNPFTFPGVIPNIDLTVPFVADCAADYVISLEVGEHIPPAAASTYIDNVCHNAKFGIVLSWAVPGQGGRGHVNERSNDWVIGEMMRRGWIYDFPSASHLRSISTLPWFKNTLMVFQATMISHTAMGTQMRKFEKS